MKNGKIIIEKYDGTSLYLRGCDLKGLTLPTTIGGYLYLRGCENVPNGVYCCGNEKRTISVYNHPEKGLVISLGCFIGTEPEAIASIKSKYRGSKAGEDYIKKVQEAFRLFLDATY